MKSLLGPLAIAVFASVLSHKVAAHPVQTGSTEHSGHSHSHSQDKSDDIPDFIEFTPETPEFKDAVDNLRKVLRRLVELELRFHNSNTTEEERKFRRQWYEVRETVWEPHRAMLQAGLAEYLTSPQEKQKLAEILFKGLKRNVESDCYEGMLPIAKALYENKYPSPTVPGLYVMCCLAENEFQQARQPLKELIESGYAQPELVAIYDNLDSLAAAWQEELKFRQDDAAGTALPQAKLMTSKGTVVIELFENQAPEAVANFISLAEKGFYNNKPFFLVLNNLLAQTGCPKGDGTGGPGYFLPAESSHLAKRHIFRGSVALNLLPNLPDSGGSQFMIAFLPLRQLEEHSRVFGRVISGMPNLARCNRVDPAAKKKEDEEKVEPDKVLSVEITGKRNHAYEPNRLTKPFRGDPPASLIPNTATSNATSQ